MDGLTNIELYEISKSNGINLNNILMIDELPKIKKGNQNIILNLQKLGSPGSHWVALIIRKNVAFYFDSFGGICPQSIITFCRNKKYRLGYNAYICQDLKAQTCGFYCLQAIRYLQTSNESNLLENANHFINTFEPLFENANENLVKHGLRNIKKYMK